MTDPNVIEAMNLLSAAVCSLATKGLSHKPSDAQHAIDLADEASELLAAAAEKPAAAPTVAAVVPVLFNGTGRAMLASGERATQTGPEGWSAEVSPDRKWLAIFVGLRPGEDAGVTVAKMLAAVGRGP